MYKKPEILPRPPVDHPNLGGRRFFLHVCIALFEHVPRGRKSRLQRPNLKALHLHSAACQWRRVEMARESLFSDNHMSEYDVEWVGMDFMGAATKPTGTCWWQEFRNIHRVRDSVTHSAGKDVGTAEDVAKAWESLMSPKLDPPDVVRRGIGHSSEREPPWVRRYRARSHHG